MAGRTPIPVVDIFAGPGGLGEGFAGFVDETGRAAFRVALSIEKDSQARETLRLRSFYRSFKHREDVPDAYFQHLRGKLSIEDLFAAFPEQANAANAEAWCAELGKESEAEIDRRVVEARGGVSEWVLIGGPPCQAYSLVGRARNGHKKNQADERHFLYRQYLRILRRHRPVAFVMENVKGLLSARVGQVNIVSRILQDLREAGYKLYALSASQRPFSEEFDTQPSDFIIRCEDYGVPQARHRLIIVGFRDDANLPAPHRLEKVEPRATVAQALAGLPELRSRLSARSGTDSSESWVSAIHGTISKQLIDACRTTQPQLAARLIEHLGYLADSNPSGSEFLSHAVSKHRKNTALWDWWYQPRLRGVCNHVARSHMTEDLGRYFYAACFTEVIGRSPLVRDFPSSLTPKHGNIDRRKKSHDFADRFRVQRSDAPSSTVTAHIAKDGHYFIHPDPRQCRSLTVREAARLQTFPDDYLFTGNRTSQYQQVGNAVPPFLALQIASSICDALMGKTATGAQDGRHAGSRPSQLEHVTYQSARH